MTRDINRIIGKNIRARRERLGLAPEDLATMLAISPESIHHLESGVLVVNAAMLIRLAMLLGCSLDLLCGLKGEPATDAFSCGYSDRSDFKKTQELIRSFITISHPQLREVAYNFVLAIASINSGEIH